MKKELKRVVGIVLVLSLVIASVIPFDSNAYNVVPIDTTDQDGNATILNGFKTDNVPVPYVDVVDYMNKVYDENNQFTLEAQGGGVYKISNAKGSMTLDATNNTLHSDKIEQFLYNDQKNEPGDNLHYVYEHIVGTEYRETPNALDIDFSNYGIDIIEEGGRLFLPLTTIADFTGVSYTNTVFYNNHIYLNYSNNKPSVNWQANFDRLDRDPGEIAYTYGELCFVFDNIYGNPPHCILADSIKNNGLDATLDSYSDETRKVKELLNSNNTVDFIFGIGILSFMLYDGGHTDLFGDIRTDLEETNAFQELIRIVKEEPDNTTVVLFNKWFNDSQGKRGAKMKIEEYDSEFDKYQAIFDEQVEDNRYRYYEYGDTGIFVYTNYDENVVRYFKKALDIAKEHGMKNFLFDDSNNGGGSTESCMYMLNAITKDKRDEFYYEATMTGNQTYEKLEYDMDQDGVFEGDNEDFNYDFNYAVMCSQGSYSSGNIFPCLCQEAGIPIIGEQSAGGTCNLVFFKMDLGSQYSMSAFRTFNYMRGGDLEAGATPDYDITKKNSDGTTDYSNFRDFALLDKIVNNHYGVDPMYRLYNPNTGEHIYTSDLGEKDYLSAIGWNYEGIGWNAPVNSDTPVYRLFNPFTSEHYYTTNEGEMFYLSIIGWNYEGIGWYSADNGMPIYRVFNPYEDGPAAHYFTANAGERDILVGLGYIDEGIGWYGL